MQETKVCSTYDRGVVQPSPTQDAWALVEEVCPSTAPESYDRATFGTSLERVGGTVTG
ncbi:hypothetical protein ABT344_15620 [Micromonospora carbonacea]|uniref:hypothetical protein n=1 Tax=Micromonospora carbonacea TaxID=47853 RepID=UPI003333E18D